MAVEDFNFDANKQEDPLETVLLRDPTMCSQVCLTALSLAVCRADEEFLAFITSFVEQRAMVLHNLKATHQGLLVKSVEVRDLDMLSVTTFMG